MTFKLHPNWKPGTGGGSGSVVSDEPTADQCTGADDVEHYGGYLVAESVPPSKVPLIAAAMRAVYLLTVIRDADNDCKLDGLPPAIAPFMRGLIDEVLTPEVEAALTFNRKGRSHV